MPTNYRLEYALKAREAIDAMGISAVVKVLHNHIGKHSSAEMTEAEVIEATAVLDREVIATLSARAIRADTWRKERQAQEDRANWNSDVEQRKADRQRRRNEKKVSG